MKVLLGFGFRLALALLLASPLAGIIRHFGQNSLQSRLFLKTHFVLAEALVRGGRFSEVIARNDHRALDFESIELNSLVDSLFFIQKAFNDDSALAPELGRVFLSEEVKWHFLRPVVPFNNGVVKHLVK